MIYEVQISVFGQKLSTTVEANNHDHLAQRVREELFVEKVRIVNDPLANLAAELKIKDLVR